MARFYVRIDRDIVGEHNINPYYDTAARSALKNGWASADRASPEDALGFVYKKLFNIPKEKMGIIEARMNFYVETEKRHEERLHVDAVGKGKERRTRQRYGIPRR